MRAEDRALGLLALCGERRDVLVLTRQLGLAGLGTARLGRPTFPAGRLLRGSGGSALRSLLFGAHDSPPASAAWAMGRGDGAREGRRRSARGANAPAPEIGRADGK